MKYKIVKNKYSYYEVEKKPSSKELQEYYAKKYYQEGAGSYEVTYSEEEKQYFLNKIAQKYQIIKPMLNKGIGKLLDVGSGEGFTLKYFNELGWDCQGLDFSDYGIKKHNPKQQNLLKKGDIFNNLRIIASQNEKFDVIWLDNVLEHVLDPAQLLLDVHKILNKDGVFVVDVPNDFSVMQDYLLKNKHVEQGYWILPPDHLSYFNKEGLANLANAAGWKVKKTISDYPIELDLLASNSNYVINSKLGKQSHQKRILFENMLNDISIEKTNKFYESLADLGLGRNIISFLIKK